MVRGFSKLHREGTNIFNLNAYTMKPLATFFALCFAVFSTNFQAHAQLSQDTIDYYSMELEDLLNMTIVTASKKSESLFESPFSVSVVTSDEIRKAGCTSITEAIRLVPGILVSEQTNGVYETQLRGHGNVPPYEHQTNLVNTTTLVMIDNRPVYNYIQGGTFWETLPIDINDVDKIEIVRGPASAIYGPNAVSGVINIITRRPQKEGLYLITNSAYSIDREDRLANISAGYQKSDKWGIIYTSNMQLRMKPTSEYYNFSNTPTANPQLFTGKYVNTVDSLKLYGNYIEDPSKSYPDPERSMEKFGNNIILYARPNDKISFDLSSGVEESQVQKVYANNVFTPITFAHSKTRYADFAGDVYGLNIQVSYFNGEQNQTLGEGQLYSFNTFDARLEYAYTYKNLYIRPGLNFRTAEYDDTQGQSLNDPTAKFLFGGKQNISTSAASLRADYLLFEKLRLTAGGRLDKFDVPDKTYLSYQLAATYLVTEKHLVRYVHSRANRSPFVMDNFANVTLFRNMPVGPGMDMTLKIEGNPNLEMVVTNLHEIGYRAKITDHLQADLEAFYTHTENYVNTIMLPTQVTVDSTGMHMLLTKKIMNIPLEVIQKGVTFSFNYSKERIQFRPYITFQQTDLKDFSKYANTPDADPNPMAQVVDPLVNNLYSGMGTTVKHQGTPEWFGGFNLNTQPFTQFNVNVNGTYFTSYNTYTQDDIISGIGDEIKGKFLLNARVSYQPVKGLDIFFTLKNILGMDSREYYYADKIGTSSYFGLRYEY